MPIITAVLLAAGEGSRLRGSAASKPLCPVAGRPLIDHALTGLAEAGIPLLFSNDERSGTLAFARVTGSL